MRKRAIGVRFAFIQRSVADATATVIINRPKISREKQHLSIDYETHKIGEKQIDASLIDRIKLY